MSDSASLRSELRSLKEQQSKPGIPERELRSLNKRGRLAIMKAGLWGMRADEYNRWLDGDDAAAARFISGGSTESPVKERMRSPPIATAQSSVPPSRFQSHQNNCAPAPQASRAAQVAEIHLAGINASRQRCGLPPLAASELAREYADLDRLPAPTKKVSRRDAGNLAVLRSGGPTDQAGLDAMWSGIAAKLSASQSASRTPIGARPALPTAGSVKPNQMSIDSMWSSLATGLNAEAGLKSLARNRAR
jgi:hypothetical protein